MEEDAEGAERSPVDRLYDRSEGLVDSLEEMLLGRPASVVFYAIGVVASVEAATAVAKDAAHLTGVATSIEQAEEYVRSILAINAPWKEEPLLLARFLSDCLSCVAVRLQAREERKKCEK